MQVFFSLSFKSFCQFFPYEKNAKQLIMDEAANRDLFTE